jgi:hypothetical protein
MSGDEEKEDDQTPNYHSLDIESLKAWWFVYRKSDKYQNHAVGPKVYKIRIVCTISGDQSLM